MNEQEICVLQKRSYNKMATAILIVSAVLIVWFQAVGSPLGGWFGVKTDLLPSLMVYAGMTVGARSVAVVGIIGGVMQDALSISPLGISIFPLCAIGFAIYQWQAYLARDEKSQQLLLGAIATFGSSVVVLFLLGMKGQGVSMSFALLLRLVGITVVGAIACPAIFMVLDRVNRLLGALPPKYEAQTAAWNFQKFRHRHPPPDRVRERAYK